MQIKRHIQKLMRQYKDKDKQRSGHSRQIKLTDKRLNEREVTIRGNYDRKYF